MHACVCVFVWSRWVELKVKDSCLQFFPCLICLMCTFIQVQVSPLTPETRFRLEQGSEWLSSPLRFFPAISAVLNTQDMRFSLYYESSQAEQNKASRQPSQTSYLSLETRRSRYTICFRDHSRNGTRGEILGKRPAVFCVVVWCFHECEILIWGTKK